MRKTAFIAFIVVSAIAACSGDQEPAKLRPAPVVPTMTPMAIAPPTKKADPEKGDKEDKEWTPAEFKTGGARWKDTGVYLDGRPIGFLNWGELPVALKPTWVRGKVSANQRPNSNDPGWRWKQQRFYKFTDYLKAAGVDVRKVKELHVYGPRFTNSVIATGADLRSPLGQKFMFRFGGLVSGKAIPAVPPGFAAGSPPDKIASVMIYIEKKPPELVRGEGFVLDGVPQEGVPYYGDPIRGGIRVYLDDRLAAIIKRQDLDPKNAPKGPDGEPAWNLAELLAAQAVDTSKVVELWVIRGEQRAEKLPGAQLPTLTFRASAQAKGGILLGPDKLRANVIALHTRALRADELPYVTPDDQ